MKARSTREDARQQTARALRDAEELVLRTVLLHQAAMQKETALAVDLSLAAQHTKHCKKQMNDAAIALDRLQTAARGQ